MPYLIVGLALLVAAIFGLRAFLGADPKTLAVLLRVLGIAAAGVIVLILILAERFALALPFLVLTMMLFGRSPLRSIGGGGGFAGSGSFASAGGGQPAAGTAGAGAKQQSEVHTGWLSMVLKHASGEIDGTVRQGQFRGKRLSELDLPQLLGLLTACRADDVQSATLLETYLDRIYGTDWRQRFEDRQNGAEARTKDAGDAAAHGRLSPSEARDILGVGPEATEAEIREAHHRLLKNLHPDHGGSTYLASQVNAAKDVLLGG